MIRKLNIQIALCLGIPILLRSYLAMDAVLIGEQHEKDAKGKHDEGQIEIVEMDRLIYVNYVFDERERGREKS